MSDHRWSGWPGAWCLDCGVEDRGELCLAIHSISVTCVSGHTMCEQNHTMQRCENENHHNSPCSESGSKRHDPYAKEKGNVT